MRIREGDFAYDIEQLRDPLTQLPSNWQFKIVRLHPAPEMVVLKGEAPNRPAAEKKAKAALHKVVSDMDEPIAA
jgi:hypothetical protein